MAYVITLLILCAVYAVSVYIILHMKKTKWMSSGLASLILICYIILAVRVYVSVGFYDWNFQNVLPVANVSPFMFATVPLILILPKKARMHWKLLISLLSVGMFFSTVFNCIYNAAIDYKFHFHFLMDYVAHFAISLLGVYFVSSGEVSLKPKSCAVSASLIYGAATLMLVLNLIFDTAFFGLSLRGKHNIYNNVIVNNSYISALLYYLGLGVILLLGYAYHTLLMKLKKTKIERK